MIDETTHSVHELKMKIEKSNALHVHQIQLINISEKLLVFGKKKK